MDINDLTLERLLPLVGSPFAVALAPPWDLRFELAEATPLAAMTSPPGAERVPFRLIFHGPTRPIHPQGILPLEHETMGRLEIFVVPIGPVGATSAGASGAAMRYEAIFT